MYYPQEIRVPNFPIYDSNVKLFEVNTQMQQD